MKELIKRIPIFGDLARKLYRKLRAKKMGPTAFAGSQSYWEDRYAAGGNSGAGSYGKFAEFKAEVVNAFVAEHDLGSVIEFGCGDGNQLTLAEYPAYFGVDVSETVVSMCRERFAGDATKHFGLVADYKGEKADLALSLDVLYHLVEDDIFERYMRTMFESANRFVIIYASDSADNSGYEDTHVRRRKFTAWIQLNLPHWKLIKHIPNKYPYQGDYTQGSFADFFIYAKA